MPRQRLPLPPSGITGPAYDWAMQVWRLLSDTPNMSYFSGTTPNSNLTGLAGDMAVNVGSASTDTRIWVKGGSASAPSMTGWVTIRTGPS